ncbi:hypothetical protein [Deinococcus sp. Marseille-Q6407]|uniref:hypothetical protein n=1 Tax=Deinococcus sp. Marseille-Q6407 TaxID=2969223 RepID=UPI0021C13B8D|nr:hypothetical protein [Deinococcus sp. Marseille-Q6407]
MRPALPTTPRVSVPRGWPQRLGAAVALLLLLALLGGGVSLWRLTGTGPHYWALDDAGWRQAAALPESSGTQQPRRNMAYAAQDWLEAERPFRAQVHGRLGSGDAFPAPDTEAYRVGCGFTAARCDTDDWLVVRYDVGGRVAETRFEPAGGRPAPGAE